MITAWDFISNLTYLHFFSLLVEYVMSCHVVHVLVLVLVRLARQVMSGQVRSDNFPQHSNSPGPSCGSNTSSTAVTTTIVQIPSHVVPSPDSDAHAGLYARDFSFGGCAVGAWTRVCAWTRGLGLGMNVCMCLCVGVGVDQEPFLRAHRRWRVLRWGRHRGGREVRRPDICPGPDEREPRAGVAEDHLIHDKGHGVCAGLVARSRHCGRGGAGTRRQIDDPTAHHLGEAVVRVLALPAFAGRRERVWQGEVEGWLRTAEGWWAWPWRAESGCRRGRG